MFTINQCLALLFGPFVEWGWQPHVTYRAKNVTYRAVTYRVNVTYRVTHVTYRVGEKKFIQR